MSDNIIKNSYGYYEVKDKPSEEELKTYYSKYYQDNKGHYSNKYDEEEERYLYNKISQKFDVIRAINPEDHTYKRFLDIGCGEGWALSFFKSEDFQVTGLDYNKHGCRDHNDDVSDFVIEGDIFDNLDSLIQKKEKYSVIWLDNVLEHVINPAELLEKVKHVADAHSIFVIEVPNDFSELHKKLKVGNFINRDFWIATPDHLSYFNKDGLINLCRGCGWQDEMILGDFPIDMLLLNDSCNYILDGSKGKDCHRMRIRTENLFSSISIEKTNKLYSALADMGLGRSIIGFFKVK